MYVLKNSATVSHYFNPRSYL